MLNWSIQVPLVIALLSLYVTGILGTPLRKPSDRKIQCSFTSLLVNYYNTYTYAVQKACTARCPQVTAFCNAPGPSISIITACYDCLTTCPTSVLFGVVFDVQPSVTTIEDRSISVSMTTSTNVSTVLSTTSVVETISIPSISTTTYTPLSNLVLTETISFTTSTSAVTMSPEVTVSTTDSTSLIIDVTSITTTESITFSLFTTNVSVSSSTSYTSELTYTSSSFVTFSSTDTSTLFLPTTFTTTGTIYTASVGVTVYSDNTITYTINSAVGECTVFVEPDEKVVRASTNVVVRGSSSSS